ncbi:MAG: hypothetical protein ACKPKO_26825, partial [Candidatus Fonsibacter sp.]
MMQHAVATVVETEALVVAVAQVAMQVALQTPTAIVVVESASVVVVVVVVATAVIAGFHLLMWLFLLLLLSRWRLPLMLWGLLLLPLRV